MASLELLLREVVSLLERARQVDKQAETQLAQLNSVEGYRICLLKAAMAQELAPDTRLMGAIMLKNGIHQFWSPAAANSNMRAEEKNILKSGLLQAVPGTPDKSVSSQLIACVAKIARHEWPEQWAELCPGLIQLVQASFDAGNFQAAARNLDLMEQVLQELSSKRLPHHRRQFQAEALKLLPPLTNIWKTQVQTFLNMFAALKERQQNVANGKKIEKLSAQHVTELALRCQLALLLTQCLQWVVVCGVDDPGGNQDVHTFFGLLLQYIHQLSDFRNGVMGLSSLTGEGRLTLHESVSELCTTMADVVLKTQTQHAVSFARFLEVFVSTFLKIFSESFEPDFPSSFKFEKLSIQALNFLSQIVACDKYGLDPNLDDDDEEDGAEEATQKAKELVRSLLNPEVATKMAQLLITGFLPLSPAKLASWEEEPEVFVHEEDVEDVDEGSTAAASGLLWGLVKAYPSAICPLIVQMLGGALRVCPPGSSISAEGDGEVSRPELLKEAVYHALSIASVILLEDETLDFDVVAIYRDALAKEISMVEIEDEGLGSRIIQRRVILLIGDWIEKIPIAQRPTIYQFTLRLLCHPDLLVSMGALSTLHNILEEAAFDDDDDDEGDDEDSEADTSDPQACVKAVDFVARHCQQICHNIFRMITMTDDLNTHEVLLDRLRLVISKAGSAALSPCVPSITQQLSMLWQSSGEEILRAPILRTLSAIVNCLGNRSEQLQSTLLPLLMEHLGSNPDRLAQQSVDSILNETIRFWRELIANARAPTEALFNLFDRFGPLVERLCSSFSKDVELGSVKAAEDLHLLLSGVLVSYVLLGGYPFMERQGNAISRVLAGALALQRQHDEEDFGVISTLDYLLQIYPSAAPALLQTTLRECLEHTLALAQKPAEASSLTAEEAEMAALVGDTPLIVKYLVLLARLLVCNAPALHGLLSHQPPAQQRHSLELLLKCFIEYTPQMDSLQSKLCGLAACNLVGLLLRGITELNSMMWLGPVLKLVQELRKPLHHPRSIEELLLKQPEIADTEEQRKANLEQKDPVRKVDITQAFTEQLRELPQNVQHQIVACARTLNLEDLASLLARQLTTQTVFHV